MRRTAALVLAALALVACGSGATGASTPPLGRGEARVVRVVDGDTIVVRLASGEEKVRLIGVDTPESVKPNTPVECYGKEATARTNELLPPGTVVRLERDKEARDRYDRLLAYVSRASDGLSVEATLLREGYAAPLAIKPNTARQDEYAAMAAVAQQGGVGLWGACGGPHVVR